MNTDVLSGGEAKEREGSWMQTFTGKQFWPLDPRADEIDIRDIAHALSMQSRFAGHCQRFLSVAEHCCMLASVTPKEYAFEALMHDSPEAYLVDVPRPVKRHLEGYYDIEHRLARVIAIRFGLEYPWPEIVMMLDTQILLNERNQNMGPSPAPLGDGWPDHLDPLDVEYEFWEPGVAEAKFLSCYQSLRR